MQNNMSNTNPSIDLVDLCSLSFFNSFFKAQELVYTLSRSDKICLISSVGNKALGSIGLILLLKLIDDLKPHVMPKSDQVKSLMAQLLKGFERENGMDSEEHSENIHDFIVEISTKRLMGELAGYPIKTFLRIEELVGDLTVEGRLVENFVDQYFTVNFGSLKQIENQKNILVNGLTKLVVYVVGEIVELAHNFTMDYNADIIGPYAIEMAITNDPELAESLPRGIRSQMGVLSELHESFFNVHTDSSGVSIINGAVLAKLVPDVHLNILKFVGNVYELLSFRTVCKYWNSLIVENDEIWKYCYHLTLIEEPLFFSHATSSRLSSLKNSDLTGWRRRFFSDIYPFLSSKRSIINSYLKSKSLDYQESFNNAVSVSYNQFRIFGYGIGSNIEHDTKIGGVPNMVSKSNLWRDGYAFVAQLSLAKFTSLIDVDLPTSGYLYFFAKLNNARYERNKAVVDSYDGYVVYQDYKDLPTVPLIQLSANDLSVNYIGHSTFGLGLSLDTRVFVDHGNENVEDFSYYNQTPQCKQYQSTFMGQYCGVYSNNFTIQKDDILLLQTNAGYPNTEFSTQFIYSIDRDSLLKREFGNAKLTIQYSSQFRYD